MTSPVLRAEVEENNLQEILVQRRKSYTSADVGSASQLGRSGESKGQTLAVCDESGRCLEKTQPSF